MQKTIKKNEKGNGSAERDGLQQQPLNELKFSNKTKSWYQPGIHNEEFYSS